MVVSINPLLLRLPFLIKMKINEHVFYLDEFYFSIEKGVIEKIEEDICIVRCQDKFLLRLNKKECFRNKKDLMKDIKKEGKNYEIQRFKENI